MSVVVYIATAVTVLLFSSQATVLHGARGANEQLLQFDRFTLPDSLVEVYGSPADGYCGQILSGEQRMCFNTDNLAVLSDDIIPGSVNMSTDYWAGEFFTLNVTNSTRIEIGFRLEENNALKEVRVFPLICPSLGMSVSSITVYGATTHDIRLRLNISAATKLGDTTVAVNYTDCATTEIVISTKDVNHQDVEFQNFFLVFNFDIDSNITWLFIGEVQFYQLLTPNTTTFFLDSTSAIMTTSSTFVDTTPSSTGLAGFTTPTPNRTGGCNCGSSRPDPTCAIKTTSPTSVDTTPSSTGLTSFTTPALNGTGDCSCGCSSRADTAIIAACVTVILVALTVSVAAHILLFTYQMRRKRTTSQDKVSGAAQPYKITDLTQEAINEDVDRIGLGGHGEVMRIKSNEAYGPVMAAV